MIELLSVMTVLSVLAVATVPAVKGTLDGINITGAAGVAESQLLLARQTAISRNLPVEVRFYKVDDGTGLAYRAMGLVIPASASGKASDEWLNSGKILPGSIVMSDTDQFSTVLTTPPTTGTETATAPKSLQSKSYVAFQYNADGSTSLSRDGTWCLTLKNPNSRPVGSAPAANYVSIVVDSLTGRTLTYQP